MISSVRRHVGLTLYGLALKIEPEIALALQVAQDRAVQARLAAQIDLLKQQADAYTTARWQALLSEHRRQLSQIVQSN